LPCASAVSAYVSRAYILSKWRSTLGPLLPNETQPGNLAGSVRELIQEAAFGSIPPEFSTDVVWGLDYSLQEKVLDFFGRHGSPDIGPFAHVLIAAGKPAERSVTLVWLVLGFEPHRFFLSRQWCGPPFCYAVVSGILRDSKTEIFDYPAEFFIGQPSPLRAIQPRGIPESVSKQHMQIIWSYRARAFQEATELVEMRRDEIVRKEICCFAGRFLGEAGRRAHVPDCLQERLRVMYKDRLATEEAQRRFSEVVRLHVMGISEEERRKTIVYGDDEAPHVDWPRWIQVDRALIKHLKTWLGLPGAMHGEVEILEHVPLPP